LALTVIASPSAQAISIDMSTNAARPGSRITELQIGSTQRVPWYYHSNVHDTFYLLTGSDQSPRNFPALSA
jgi:hypothetical protein